MSRLGPPFALSVLSLCLGLVIPARGAAPTAREIADRLEPDRVPQATLAPDGRHLAYIVHEDQKTTIVLVDVDDPTRGAVVPVGDDTFVRDAGDSEKTPLQIPFIRWAGPDRLVFSVEIPGLPVVDVRRASEPTQVSVVYAVDANGRNLTKLADADDLALVTTADGVDDATGGNDAFGLPRQPRVLDLSADEPDTILVEAVRPALNSDSTDPNVYGRLATGLFKINTRTGKRGTMYERDVAGRLFPDRQGNLRIESLRPIDKRVDTFVYLASPPGQTAIKSLDQLLGDPISPENYLGARTFPVGFDFDPNILYLASNVGRDTYGLYALDLRTGKRTALAVEHPAFDLAGFEQPFSDSALVFDRARRRLVGVRFTGLEAGVQWLDPELAGLQSELEGKFPGRSVQLVDWDDARTRFLTLVSGASDPGRYWIFRRPENRLVQFIRRAPSVELDEINPAGPFAFDTPEGVHLTGYLTLPRVSLVNPPSLLVYCHDGPWARDEPGFNRDTQALAAMGFLVAQVNYRGSAGFGTRHREASRQDIDRITIADIRATIAWIASQHKFDRKRVALIGAGFGGYLALRALQLYPEEFRCAVAINAPTDLELWCRTPESRQEKLDRQEDTVAFMRQQAQFMNGFGRPAGGPLATAPLAAPSYAAQNSMAAPTAGASGGPPLAPPNAVNFLSEFRRWYFGRDAARLAAISPARHPELLTKPVLLIQDPLDVSGESGESPALRAALAHSSAAPDYLEITSAFTRGLPGARAKVFLKLEEFFNLNIYDFNVKIGEIKEKK
jgi:dipeptidyl aminopeptidase/acylaminoacyl peptidase